MATSRLCELMKSIADAIRFQHGTTEDTERIPPCDFPDEIRRISARPEAPAGVYVVEDKTVDINSGSYTGMNYIRVFGKGYGRQFEASQSLRKVQYNEGVEEIGYRACYGAEALDTVILPTTLKTLGASAFQGAEKLSTIVLSDGLTKKLPDGLTEIPASCFLNCYYIAELELPDSIKTIGKSAFSSDARFVLTKLPENLETIDEAGFYKVSSSFKEIPPKVTTIGKNAFYNNTGLTEITFKGTPSSVASTAFSGCSNITTINVPWAEGAVANAPWGATSAIINYNYTEGE